MTPWDQRDIEKDAEDNGVWVTSKAIPTWEFRVRRLCDWNSSHHRAVVRIAQDDAVKDYIRRSREPGYQLNDRDRTTDRAMQLMIFIEGCLSGWRGVTGRDGELLPFSPSNAAMVLQHFPDILAQLQAFAVNPDNYRNAPDPKQGALPLGNLSRGFGSSQATGQTH